MGDLQDIIKINQQMWGDEVQTGGQNTIPNLNLKIDLSNDAKNEIYIQGGIILKNNLIIAGTPRTGKSTISNKLSKIFGYQHVSMDSINAGFEKVFPELGINTSAAGMTSIEILIDITAQ